MINKVLTTVFGSEHERNIKKLQPLVVAINDLEPEMKALTDDQLRAKTVEFRERLAQGPPSTTSWCRPSRRCARGPGAASTCAPSTSS